MITAMDKLNRRLENRLHIIQGDPSVEKVYGSVTNPTLGTAPGLRKTLNSIISM